MAAVDPVDPRQGGRRSTTVAPGASWWQAAQLSVLVADEDAATRAVVPALLGPGVNVTQCGDGAEALWHAGRTTPVLVLLSASLPRIPAAEVATVLTRLQDGVGTVAVGVAAGEADRAGPVLAAGARHVVSRPYRAPEIEALLAVHRERAAREAPVLVVGELELNGPAFEARAAGRPLALSLREFELLRLLMLHADGVLSLSRISQEIWEPRGETVSANTIAVHMRHLRRHVQGVASIVSVRGVGYRLAVDDKVAAQPSIGDGHPWHAELSETGLLRQQTTASGEPA